jgi:uncharacterized membrane protein
MKRLAPLALAVVVVACSEERPLAPRSRIHAVAASANLSGASTANATVTYLGALPGYTGAAAMAINASGRAVGFVGNAGLAVSFDPPTLLYRQENYPFDGASVAYGINDAGVISGEGSHDFGRKTFAGALPGGWLPPLPGAGQQFGGYINNAGEVVANTFFDPLNRTPGHATLWVPGADGYSVVDLGTFNDNTIYPRAITRNRSGSNRIIVGGGELLPGGPGAAVAWQNGQWSELPLLEACANNQNKSGTASGVSDDGRIVGISCAGAVLWENGTVRDLQPQCQALLPPGWSGASEALAIAVTSSVPSRILIVGFCIDSPTVWYDDGQGGYTAEFLPLLEGDTEGKAYDVNSAGQIVGYTRKSPFSTDPTAHAVRWTFTPPPLSGTNLPPVAAAGPDQTVECASHHGTDVALDGSGSNDPDGTIAKYEWFEGDALVASGAAPTVLLGMGVHNLRLVVTDNAGATDDDGVVITVPDTRAPEVSLSASPGSLWPPNHKYYAISVSASASDVCDANLAVSGSVVSSEPDDDQAGDGDHTGDVRVVRADGTVLVSSKGTAAVPFNPLAGDRLELRAERKGDGLGRTYTITLTATDHSGNSATKTFIVTVAHDNGT